jgi:hypothetical protein
MRDHGGRPTLWTIGYERPLCERLPALAVVDL